MRLPPSVVSLIESHLLPTDLKAAKSAFRALGPGHPRHVQAQPRGQPQSQVRQTKDGQRLSLHRTLRKYPNNPQISLGVAHRLLDEHAIAPSPSSRTLQLLSRQAIYERIIRTFASAPSHDTDGTQQIVTGAIASIYQRMIEEGVPPNTNTLKIVLGTALRNNLPILPILRQVVEGAGLPDKMDTHLLLLVAKGLVREVGLSPKELGVLVDECLGAAGLAGEERPVGFIELMVEAYGRAGNLKGMISVLDRFKADLRLKDGLSGKDKDSALRLYLQAMSQWCSNPLLRRKRHGSLFPRAIARDMVALYGKAHDLPLPFLNAWMNGERVAGNTDAGLAIWDLIGQPDTFAYSTYFRLLGNCPHSAKHHLRIRTTVKALLASPVRLDVGLLEHSISAAFRHKDLPLALLLARRIDPSADRHHRHKVTPTSRLIDILASGLIGTWRQGGLDRIFNTSIRRPNVRGEHISRSEWEMILSAIQDQAAQTGRVLKLDTVTLPLSSPQATLVPSEDGENRGVSDYVGRFKPGQGSCSRDRATLVEPLVELLEKAVVALALEDGRPEKEKHETVLKVIMSRLNADILP